MTPRTSTGRAAGGRTQRRGDVRRDALLRALGELLKDRDPPDLTFANVCQAAGVPPGSARFFYRDTQELLRALMAEMAGAHDAALLRPFRRSDLKSWRTLIECVIERSARFQRANPVFAKLTISGQTLPELKRLDRDADRQRGEQVVALLGEYFVVPRVPHVGKIAYLVTEVVDLAFTLSMNESGRITPEWLDYAKRSATTLLAHFFGGELARRPTATDVGIRRRKRGRSPV